MVEESSNIHRQWWLRTLGSEKLPLLERSLLQSESVAMELRNAEYDLFDDHAQGRLNAHELAPFETHFLGASENRLRLQIARALVSEKAAYDLDTLKKTAASANQIRVQERQVAAEQFSPAIAESESFWRRPKNLRIAAVLVAAVVVGPLIYSNMRHAAPPPQPAKITAPASPSIPTFALLDGLRRSGVAAPFNVDANIRHVRLQMEVGPKVSINPYSVRVLGPSGVVFVANALHPQVVGNFAYVEALVPVSALTPGQRSVTVEEGGVQAQNASPWNLEIHIVGATGADSAEPKHAASE